AENQVLDGLAADQQAVPGSVVGRPRHRAGRADVGGTGDVDLPQLLVDAGAGELPVPLVDQERRVGQRGDLADGGAVGLGVVEQVQVLVLGVAAQVVGHDA